MAENDDLRFWVGFNRIAGIGPVRLARLLEFCDDVEQAWHASPATLRAAGLPQDVRERFLYERTRIDLNADLAQLEGLGAYALTWKSEGYPPMLRSIDQAPPVIYVRGELAPADEWAIAVVGTRRASVYGKEVTRRLAGGLAESGITVISGLALGIDGIAHKAALDAGGRTIAVLGSGVDLVYPARHRSLAERIMAQGALISDYSLGTPPEAGNFPPRNRIISGLSLGTVVVEAGRRSGALITLRYALEQGRETFAVPGNIFNRTSQGTNAALQRGEAKLVTQVEDIVEELNLSMAVEQREVRAVVPENETEEALLSCLDHNPTHIDAIVRQVSLPTATVSSVLCMMELKGMVRRVDNMSYVRAH